MTSIARVILAGGMDAARATARSRSASGRWPRSARIAARNTVRNSCNSDVPILAASRPACSAPSIAVSAWAASRSISDWKSASRCSPPWGAPPAATTWSSADKVSRADPPPARITYWRSSGVISISASPTTWSMRSPTWLAESSENSRCCVRLRMVGTTLFGSVVHNTKTTCGGGSSRVFNSAFSAPDDNMWTSSRM